MKLLSPAFKNGQYIPSEFTCDGERSFHEERNEIDTSPPLEIFDVPEKSKSLVLIVSDPNAPNGDWTHWLVWNIKPENQFIKRGQKPEGATEGITSFGRTRYGGPCPPTGTHVYLFKLYAIDVVLPEDPSLTKSELRRMIEDHIIEKTLLRGYYERAHGENF